MGRNSRLLRAGAARIRTPENRMMSWSGRCGSATRMRWVRRASCAQPLTPMSPPPSSRGTVRRRWRPGPEEWAPATTDPPGSPPAAPAARRMWSSRAGAGFEQIPGVRATPAPAPGIAPPWPWQPVPSCRWRRLPARSSSLLRSFIDHRLDALALDRGQIALGEFQQGGDRPFHRAAEERRQNVTHGGAARARDRRRR